jgi:hypothetical protein
MNIIIISRVEYSEKIFSEMLYVETVVKDKGTADGVSV